MVRLIKLFCFFITGNHVDVQNEFVVVDVCGSASTLTLKFLVEKSIFLAAILYKYHHLSVLKLSKCFLNKNNDQIKSCLAFRTYFWLVYIGDLAKIHPLAMFRSPFSNTLPITAKCQGQGSDRGFARVNLKIPPVLRSTPAPRRAWTPPEGSSEARYKEESLILTWDSNSAGGPTCNLREIRKSFSPFQTIRLVFRNVLDYKLHINRSTD